MKKLMAVAAFLIFGTTQLSQANTSQSTQASKPEVMGYNLAAGKEAATPCGACHGSDGNSSDPQYPRLAGQNANYIYKQLIDFKSGKRNNAIMASQVANLTEEQMYNIAHYFATQQSSVSMADASIVEAGEKLYRGGDGSRGLVPCAGCHGPAGKGNDPAVFPKVGGQHAGYIKAQLEAFRAAGREDDVADSKKRVNDAAKAGEKGMMQMVAASLTDKDIKLLSNFLSGLHDK